MKAPHLITFSLAAAASLLGVGCASSADTSHTNRNRGAVGGAAAGAVIGGLIGANSSKVSTEGGAAIGAIAGGLAGGAVGDSKDRRNENRNSAPIYSSTNNGYTVQTVPLAPVSEPQETMTPQPTRDAVWIRGHYAWTGNAYQWQPGRWEVPPSGSRVWVPASWQPTNGGYVYTHGHWQ